MAEFVNWDHTEQGQSQPAAAGTNLDFAPVPSNNNFDLALANIEGDDFSYWALEHFETSHLGPAGTHASIAQSSACEVCQASGYDCERSNEGPCTTCVKLNLECSLLQQAPGLSSTVTTASPSTTGAVDPADPQAQRLRQEADQKNGIRGSSSPDTSCLDNGATCNDSSNEDGHKVPAMPKIGARFSRESVRILRTWLATHTHRPYPNDEEREGLQRQTGLNKTQISNWLANARRRSKTKYQGTRSTSPSVRGISGAIEIPQRRGTASTESEYLSPLQRWQNSPPENEPASVTAIASAILQSNSRDLSLNSPFSLTDDDAGRSCKGSSASSFGTSPSSASFASAYSHGSRGSFGSFEQRGRRRRRRRIVQNGDSEKSRLTAPPKTFQCTFCTESFRTKHDWQRHEKSLHLSLERWVCSPNNSKAVNPETKQSSCVFCGVADPGTEHIEGHNYTSCQEKSLSERTFYRKDHLRQHLKLVHNVKYLNWSMDTWKVPTPDIRSRCGFCDTIFQNWPTRVDHLAEHFKTGYDMRSWKGDWGFSPAVRAMVENAIPPFMIYTERSMPLPYKASNQASKSPRNAYELIKTELLYALYDRQGPDDPMPSDDEMQYEACRIIYAAGSPDSNERAPVSWLRDLLLSAKELSLRARMSPLRNHLENFSPKLLIKGKHNIWEDCTMDKQLAEFVQARRLLGLSVTRRELQIEACNIVARLEDCSTMPSENFANFLLRLILKCPRWLKLFCYSHGVIPVDEALHEASLKPVNASVNEFSRLERELVDFVRNHRATSSTGPSDDEIRKHARCIVHKCQNTWQTTAADDADWLKAFKERHSQTPSPQPMSKVSNSPSTDNLLHLGSNLNNVAVLLSATGSLEEGISPAETASPSFGANSSLRDSQLMISGSVCYRRLARELSRFVITTMSPNNPNRHVPTDQEMQHQARWILYDDDDPINHTAADNAEWLLQFKRSVGILPEEPNENNQSSSWDAGVDPFANSDPWQDPTLTFAASATTNATVPLLQADLMQIDSGPFGSLEFDAAAELQNLQNLPPSGAVFVSREFEDKLVQFAVAEVASSGRMPADEAIQARAKEISGLEVWQAQTTPAEDPVLLAKFKELVVNKVKAVLGGYSDGPSPPPTADIHKMPTSTTLPIAVHHQNQHTPERGMDAIDLGLLPDLGTSESPRQSPRMVVNMARKNGPSPPPPSNSNNVVPDFHVAISEEKLDEMIKEMSRKA